MHTSNFRLLLLFVFSAVLLTVGMGALEHEYSHGFGPDAEWVAEHVDAHGKHVAGHVCEICIAFAQFGPALHYQLPVLVLAPHWMVAAAAIMRSHRGPIFLAYYAQAPPL